MRDELEHLLRAADVPDPDRAELLWAEYRAGGPGADRAFATLLAWYGHALYRRVWGFVRSAAAEDVFQDVLAALHRHRRDPRLARFADALPWLRTVADNACRDHLRRVPRRKRREDARAVPERDDRRPDERAELQEVLTAALGRLPAVHRQAVALVFFEGLDKRTAAAVMGINRDTLAKRLGEALDRLRVLVPAPAVMVAGGVAGLEGALAAAIPQVSAARLTELAGRAAAQAAAAGPTLGKVVTAVAIGLTVGSAALVGWAMTRTEEPPPPADQALGKRPEVTAPVESVSDRNLRIFKSEVLARQKAALKGLVIGDGEVVLASVTSGGTWVQCGYTLRHEAGASAWPSSRVEFVHNTAGRHTHTYFDMTGTGEARRIDPTRAMVLGRNPLTGADLVLKSEPLERAVAAFGILPSDDRTAAEARADLPHLKQSLAPFLQRWYVCGDPGRGFNLQWLNDGVAFVDMSPTGPHFAFQASSVWVDPAGRAHGLPYTLGVATLSADGRRVDIDGTDEWWSREPGAAPGK